MFAASVVISVGSGPTACDPGRGGRKVMAAARTAIDSIGIVNGKLAPRHNVFRFCDLTQSDDSLSYNVSGMLQPGQHLGIYRLDARIGAGGMGEVWKAEDTRLGRAVAIKILPPTVAADSEAIARMKREARTAAQL